MNLLLDGIISLVGVATFGLLIVPTTFRWRMRERAIFTLSFYLALGLIWSIGTAVETLNVVPGSNQILFFSLSAETSRAVMPVIFGALTLAFLTRTTALYWYWGFSIIVLTLWVAIRFNLNQVNDYVLSLLPAISDINIVIRALEFLLWSVATLVALGIVFRSLNQKRQAQFRNRLRYWIGGMVILSMANSIILTQDPTILWLGSSLNIVGASLITYIVMRSHPPDLGVITNQVLRSTTITLVSSVILFAALYSAYALDQYFSDLKNVPLLLVITAIAAAIILPRVSGLLDRGLTKLLLGSATDTDSTLRAYTQNVVGAEWDLNQLGQQALNFVLKEMGVSRGALFVREGDGSGHVALKMIAGNGIELVNTGYFFADDPWIRHMRQEQTGVTQYDLEVLPEYKPMDENSKDWLGTLDVELFYPIILRQQELMGILALGHKPNNQPFLSPELNRLNLLSSQIALDMDKAKMFNQLGSTNQKLGELSSKLASFDQGKTDFLSIASHELRTPLTHIHGYASMLLEATEEELQNPAYLQHVFNGIAKGSNRLKGVMDLIFDVSRADIGELHLSFGPVGLKDVVQMAIEKENDAIAQRKHRLILSGLEQLPMITGDMKRLVQAMTHLINNAVKYTPDNGTITISGLTAAEEGQAYIEIIVTDTGIGINPEDHEKIFEKFYRVGNVENHSTSSVKFKGAGPGLGLPLVAGIAQAHGGRVWVESPKYDETTCPGSQFHLVLPITTSVEKDGEAPTGAISSSLAQTRHWRSEDLKAIQERVREREKEHP